MSLLCTPEAVHNPERPLGSIVSIQMEEYPHNGGYEQQYLDEIEFFFNFVELVLHPRSNGTAKVCVMDCVRLRVQTVPVSDSVTLEVHTLCNAMWPMKVTRINMYVPKWTLRDAIENLCNWFHIDRHQIKLPEPYISTKDGKYDCQ